MAQLEQLQPNAALRGILPDALVAVVSVQWFGSEALELTYKTPTGKVANELLYRHDEPRLEVVEQGRPWSFDGDGSLFRLVSEACRIRLAHLFDPVLAVHTSLVEPLPPTAHWRRSNDCGLPKRRGSSRTRCRSTGWSNGWCDRATSSTMRRRPPSPRWSSGAAPGCGPSWWRRGFSGPGFRARRPG